MLEEKVLKDHKHYKPRNKKIIALIFSLFLIVFYTSLYNWNASAEIIISKYGFFFLLGLAGALVANSTGAGGGVIFIPFFSAIGFTETQSVATSMAIQCFGMTAGAISWLISLSNECQPQYSQQYKSIKYLLLITGISSITGMLCGQYFLPKINFEIKEIFKYFSIIFGILLFVFTLLQRKRKYFNHYNIITWHFFPIIVTCFFGSIMTSWISVGVGEFIALLLFFLGYKARLAVAIGVYTSSISVLTGVVKHVYLFDNVSYEVLIFAAQAALIGGYFAKYITKWMGSFYLKLFFSFWILGTGFFMI